jgi:adducin
LIYNHITAAVPEEEGHFLINPFGLLFNEITASSLVKVDINGNIIDPGNTNFQVNKPGFFLHSCIHKVRTKKRV